MNNEIKFLTPFKRMCMTIGTLPSSFYASMSYYESMVWLYEYLKNEVIPVVNNNSEVAQELQTAFTELETYIRTYFDNLDIQEEVNTKLDEMAEDGTLADLVAEYVKMQGQLVYNTVADMKVAENIQNGSFLKTYGYYTVGDHGGALYKARTITNEDVIDDASIIALHDVTLVAELIPETKLNIRQFGLKCDASEDESSKFQNALTFCKNNNIKLIVNKTDSIIINSKINIINNEIEFNQATIIPNNQLYVIFDVNNSIIDGLKIRYNTDIQSGLGIVFNLIGDNTIIRNCDLQAFIGIYSNTNINNIKIHDNILNNIRNNILLQNGIIKNIEIYNNMQTIPQTQETPNASNNCILVFSGIKYPFDTVNKLTKANLEDTKGSNINIYNNKFKQINLRSIYVSNIDHANIYNNYTDNPYGDKTDHTRIGYSDDVYVLDLCTNSNISNNVVNNSGENGIDILSCKNISCSNNKLNGINSDGINIDVSDVYSNNAIVSDIDITYMICENVNVSNNEIETDNVAVSLLYGINTTITDNIMKSTPAGDSGSTQVAVLLTTDPNSRFLSEVGYWGNLIIKNNQFIGKMKLANQRGQIWTNDNSHIYLSENNGRVFTINVDNTNYADGKIYTFAHDEKYNNCKIYVVDPSNQTREYELPLTNDGTKGIVNYSNGRYAFSVSTKQVFTNLPQTAQTATYYNLSVGTLKVHLW